MHMIDPENLDPKPKPKPVDGLFLLTILMVIVIAIVTIVNKYTNPPLTLLCDDGTTYTINTGYVGGMSEAAVLEQLDLLPIPCTVTK